MVYLKQCCSDFGAVLFPQWILANLLRDYAGALHARLPLNRW